MCIEKGFGAINPWEWPVEHLTIGGVLYTKAEAIRVMHTHCAQDKTYDLFRELAATMLNLFCGCNPECIQETVECADHWLVAHPVGSDVHANSHAWKLAKQWWKQLEQYNKGLLCEESCNCPPDSPRDCSQHSKHPVTMHQLQVYVSDVDYDELSVSFYNACNDSIMGEYSMVESDSIVSLSLDEVSANESFSWYVIVSDQQAATMSPTWTFTIDANDTETMNGDNETSDNTSSPPGSFDFVDLSPLTADAHTTYTFQVQALNNSSVPEIMVVYWCNETTQTSLMLCDHEGSWNASIIIASNVTRFWYRLYIAYETGLWNPMEEHEVSIPDGGDGP
ncbi:MAG TPA: hypothetical protein VN377_04410 [Candidatus Thermoplasmatota archaeon]|nr:hypothetical protein [Candidatus Thermoplasmatota archaeon]